MNTLALELKKIPSWVKDAALVIGSSLLISLFAFAAITLPFTAIPIALQSSLVLLLSVVLGSKRAPAAVALFLAQGACGLPVFAKGYSGIAWLVGPDGGYLFGYLVAAYTTGKLVEIFGQRTLSKAFLAMCAGNTILFVLGAAWLSLFVGGVQQAILLGVTPFIIGDLIKLAAALKILDWLGWAKSSKITPIS